MVMFPFSFASSVCDKNPPMTCAVVIVTMVTILVLFQPDAALND